MQSISFGYLAIIFLFTFAKIYHALLEFHEVIKNSPNILYIVNNHISYNLGYPNAQRIKRNKYCYAFDNFNDCSSVIGHNNANLDPLNIAIFIHNYADASIATSLLAQSSIFSNINVLTVESSNNNFQSIESFQISPNYTIQYMGNNMFDYVASQIDFLNNHSNIQFLLIPILNIQSLALAYSCHYINIPTILYLTEASTLFLSQYSINSFHYKIFKLIYAQSFHTFSTTSEVKYYFHNVININNNKITLLNMNINHDIIEQNLVPTKDAMKYSIHIFKYFMSMQIFFKKYIFITMMSSEISFEEFQLQLAVVAATVQKISKLQPSYYYLLYTIANNQLINDNILQKHFPNLNMFIINSKNLHYSLLLQFLKKSVAFITFTEFLVDEAIYCNTPVLYVSNNNKAKNSIKKISISPLNSHIITSNIIAIINSTSITNKFKSATTATTNIQAPTAAGSVFHCKFLALTAYHYHHTVSDNCKHILMQLQQHPYNTDDSYNNTTSTTANADANADSNNDSYNAHRKKLLRNLINFKKEMLQNTSIPLETHFKTNATLQDTTSTTPQHTNFNFNFKLRPPTEPSSITVILTHFKRQTTLQQLYAIHRQTIAKNILKILIYQDLEHSNVNYLFSASNLAQFTIPYYLIHSKSRNFKYHGRFALALLQDSEYVVIIDDDTLIGPAYLEAALRLSQEYTAIVGPQGLVVGRDRQYIIAPPTDYPIEVDYVGRGWFFRTEWSHYFWREFVPSWECCEDITISAAAWIHGAVKTIVPAQPLADWSRWGDVDGRFHHDGNHTYMNPIPLAIRWPLTRYWLSSGWVPVALRDEYNSYESICLPPIEEGCRAAYDYTFHDILLMQHQPLSLYEYITEQEFHQYGMIVLFQTTKIEVCAFFHKYIDKHFKSTLGEILSTEGCYYDDLNSNSVANKLSDICMKLKPWFLYYTSRVENVWNALNCY